MVIKQEDCEHGLTLIVCLKNQKIFKEICQGMGYAVLRRKDLNDGKPMTVSSLYKSRERKDNL